LISLAIILSQTLSRFFKGAAAYPLLAEALGDRGAAQSLASGSNKKRASAS
jgi:hypothetical protein